MKNVLVIAASDPSGGAGIEADIKVLTAHHVNAVTAMTALTLQDSAIVHAVLNIHHGEFSRILDIIRADRKLDGIKTGALATAEHVKAVIKFIEVLDPRPIVVIDPVLVSTSGARLLDSEAVSIFRDSLVPLATLVTPNLAEAQALTGMEMKDIDSLKKAARMLVSAGADACLIKGGHMRGDSFDLLFYKGEFTSYTNRLYEREFHGTGCALASALVARLVQGFGIKESVMLSRSYLALAMSRAFPGKGDSWLLDLTVRPPSE